MQSPVDREHNVPPDVIVVVVIIIIIIIIMEFLVHASKNIISELQIIIMQIGLQLLTLTAGHNKAAKTNNYEKGNSCKTSGSLQSACGDEVGRTFHLKRS